MVSASVDWDSNHHRGTDSFGNIRIWDLVHTVQMCARSMVVVMVVVMVAVMVVGVVGLVMVEVGSESERMQLVPFYPVRNHY